MIVQISEFVDSHMKIIVKLLNEEYRNSFEFIPFNEERVRSQVRRRDLRVLVAEENGEVLGLVATYAEKHSEENIFWLAARQDQKKETVENVLVNEVEKNAKGGTISVMVDDGSPRIKDWIDRGYTLEPGFLRMFAKLDGAKTVPKVFDGVTLRGLKVSEEEELVAVVNIGFGWQRLKLGILEKWKSEDPPFNESWVHVAEFNGKIVSAVVARPDTDYLKCLHLQRGYLGPAVTLPEFRNMHLASALTARTMNFLFEKGFSLVRLGTSERNTSSITLLRGLGFEVGNVRKILRKKLRNG